MKPTKHFAVTSLMVICCLAISTTTEYTSTTELSTSTTKAEVGLGENCTSQNECRSNAMCDQTKKLCTCKDGYFNYNGDCSETAKLNPKKVKANTGSKSVTVTWEEPLQDCTSCSYNITWTGSGETKKITVHSTSIKLTELQPEVTYTITVQTLYVDSSGNTVKSKEKITVSAKIMESQAENLKVSDVTSSTVVVSFDEPQSETRDAFRLEFKKLKDNSSYCVFLIRKSTSYNMCDDYMKTKSPLKCNQRESVPAYDKHITYTVMNLMFYTNYSITVVMVTCDNGSGRESDPATQNITTKPAKPGKVENLRATSNTSHVCAIWLPPRVYPGPLGYNVQLVDNVSETTVGRPERKKHCESSNRFCKETSLLAGFWEYGFEVSAVTSTGSGEKEKSDIVITGVKKPTVEVRFIDADGRCCGYSCNVYAHRDYRKIQISWKDPEPIKRGTRLSRYVITVTNPTNNQELQRITEDVSSSLTSVNNSIYRRSPSQPHDVNVDVIPGNRYSFKFEAHDDSGNTYYLRESTCLAPSGNTDNHVTVTVTVILVCVAFLVGVTVGLAPFLWRLRKKKETDYILTVAPMYQYVPERNSVVQENRIYEDVSEDVGEDVGEDHGYAEIN